MRPEIAALALISLFFGLLSRTIEAALVAECNLRALGDFEVVKDQYKILYKEHLYSLKEHIDNFVNQNELVLFETYRRLSSMLNDTRIDASGEFVSIKYKLLTQLQDNRDDLMQVYVAIRHKVNEIAYKLISYIENNNVDKQTLYFLEYTLEQVLRQLKSCVPHSKHYNVLQGIKSLPYLFLHQNEISS